MVKKLKSSLLVTIMLVAALIVPSVSTARADNGYSALYQAFQDMDPEEVGETVGPAIGGIFSSFGQLGTSGEALGTVLSLLFTQLLNISLQETLDGTYVLNASYETTENYTENYGETGQHEVNYHYIDHSLYNDTANQNKYYFATTETGGSANVSYTYGVSIVFIIWDPNDSFINAIKKIVKAGQDLNQVVMDVESGKYTTEQEIQKAQSKVIEIVLDAFLYLIIHINDIITGDELLIANIFTWETFHVKGEDTYAQGNNLKCWDPAANGGQGGIVDEDINTYKTEWLNTAQKNKDDYMIRLINHLDETSQSGTAFDKTWSTFSFNMIQVWLKTFYISLNVSAIVQMLVSAADSATDGGDGEFTGNQEPEINFFDIFNGLDIEVYFMTHTLLGVYAFNDSDQFETEGSPDFKLSTYKEEQDFDGNGVLDNRTKVETEIDYYFVLGDVEKWIWMDPKVEGDELTWGIRAENIEMAAIRIGENAKDTELIKQDVDYFELGLSFKPSEDVIIKPDELEGYSSLENPNEAVEMMGSAMIKMDIEFGKWNNGGGLTDNKLIGYDITVLFLSTILRIKLDIDVMKEAQEQQEGTDPNANPDQKASNGLVKTESYNQETGEIKIGDNETSLPVQNIDIVGPNYVVKDGPGTNGNYPAQTNTIPLAFASYQANTKDVYEDSANPNEKVVVEGFLELEATAVLYSISYPMWSESNGGAIIHDPTFSVFMDWDNPAFWAWILVIGSVTLVGVAALLITKRKNMQ